MDCSKAGGALEDAASVQLVPAHPPLQPADWTALQSRLECRFSQFVAQGRIRAYAVELVAGGAGVLMAWEGDAVLSGCSRDALARDLLAAETDTLRLLSAPPLLIEVAGVPRALDRTTLRALIASGEVAGDAGWYDLRIERLGDWRQRGWSRLDASELGRSLLGSRVQG